MKDEAITRGMLVDLEDAAIGALAMEHSSGWTLETESCDCEYSCEHEPWPYRIAGVCNFAEEGPLIATSESLGVDVKQAEQAYRYHEAAARFVALAKPSVIWELVVAELARRAGLKQS